MLKCWGGKNSPGTNARGVVGPTFEELGVEVDMVRRVAARAALNVTKDFCREGSKGGVDELKKGDIVAAGNVMFWPFTFV